jgi:hypothetical protein
MATDYPAHLLAREPAPAYAGEGPFALWHFSEDPSLGWFRPHTPATKLQERRVTSSTVEFSGSRLHNSAPHPDRFE